MVENKAKKILFLINKFSIGGAERMFINQLKHINQNEFNVYVATVLKSKNDDFSDKLGFIPDCKKRCLEFNSVLSIKAWLKTLRFVRNQKFTIIYSTLKFSSFVARVISIFIPKTKIIIRETNISEKKNVKDKLIEKLFKKKVSSYVVNSEKVKESLKKFLNIKDEKIALIPNGVDLNGNQQVDKNNLRSKLGFSKDDFLILNVANYKTKQKGHTYLIEALGKVIHDYNLTNVKLILVGGGGLESELKKQAKDLNIEKNIYFLGFVKEVFPIYQIADLFVLSSLWEGSPNVVLEAMAYGVPVISTNVGGVQELIGVNGTIIEPGKSDELAKAITDLIEDEALRNQYSLNGIKLVKERYSMEDNINKLEELFRNV